MLEENVIIAFFHDYGHIVFVVLGLCSMGGAIRQWSWFVNNWRARKAAKKTGGNVGMRIFYFVIGLGFFVIGVISWITDISVLYLIPMAEKDPLSLLDLL